MISFDKDIKICLYKDVVLEKSIKLKIQQSFYYLHLLIASSLRRLGAICLSKNY